MEGHVFQPLMEYVRRRSGAKWGITLDEGWTVRSACTLDLELELPDACAPPLTELNDRPRVRLLDDRRCTIHWEHIDGLSEEFPNLDITNDLFEIDGNRVTCSGGTASLDMILNLITQTHGAALAADHRQQVDRQLGVVRVLAKLLALVVGHVLDDEEALL